ncbi:hypothetical protein CCR94_12675 [Rhodoblastus sphagnicola]|uniref:Uncharacterized protein n=1 Tax=Rhodoblastus sphagnicola TaxID=333368 RepID=A0A2S6N705_9HYPH|nr:hypothetical protein CCR94_12675 [Rhodoblastus sphagnicola]
MTRLLVKQQNGYQEPASNTTFSEADIANFRQLTGYNIFQAGGIETVCDDNGDPPSPADQAKAQAAWDMFGLAKRQEKQSGSTGDITASQLIDAATCLRSQVGANTAIIDGLVKSINSQTGYFGSSRATLDSVMASGGTVNVLSYLTSSDIDLIQKTTGVSIKEGGYYDSDGKEVGLNYDSQGNLSEPNAAKTIAAFNLAQTLSEMRISGGPQGDASLKSGRAITAEDLETYVKYYAAANASDKNVYMPDIDAIKQAEKTLRNNTSA